jgi:hypothetical protein
MGSKRDFNAATGGPAGSRLAHGGPAAANIASGRKAEPKPRRCVREKLLGGVSKPLPRRLREEMPLSKHRP